MPLGGSVIETHFIDAPAEFAEIILDGCPGINGPVAPERDGPDRTLRGVPRSMPALGRAQQLSVRAARVGFDWPDVAGCRAKVAEEIIARRRGGANSSYVDAL